MKPQCMETALMKTERLNGADFRGCMYVSTIHDHVVFTTLAFYTCSKFESLECSFSCITVGRRVTIIMLVVLPHNINGMLHVARLVVYYLQ
jgi:uncharacterized PurR-regulated membrane protein YhhQ (DUF165 family)